MNFMETVASGKSLPPRKLLDALIFSIEGYSSLPESESPLSPTLRECYFQAFNQILAFSELTVLSAFLVSVGLSIVSFPQLQGLFGNSRDASEAHEMPRHSAQ